MKLSWTFYPKGESDSVTLAVIYVPQLDTERLPSGGFLSVTTNTAYVDWATYKRFDTADAAERKDAFSRLTRIAQSTDMRSANGNWLSFPPSEP